MSTWCARLCSMAIEGKFQIGEVSEAVGLSIRTIRHYDEMGVVEPSGRSSGGFRLYTDRDVERLRLVKRLKPLQFSLDEIQELLALKAASAANELGEARRERLAAYASTAEERCESLRDQLRTAEDVATDLRAAVLTPTSSRRR